MEKIAKNNPAGTDRSFSLPNARRHLGTLVRVVLSIVLLGVLFTRIDREAFVKTVSSMHMGYYLLGFALQLIAVGWLWAVRVQLILKATKIVVGVWPLMVVNFIGNFLSNFLPTVVGGDVARIMVMTHKGGNSAQAVSTVFLDRLIGLASVVAMAIMAIVVGYQVVGNQPVILPVVLLGAGLAILSFLLFNRRFMEKWRWVLRLPLVKRIEGRLREIYRMLYAVHEQPRLLALAFGVALVGQVVETLGNVYVARAVGIQTPLVYFFIFIPLIWIVTMVPISLGGVGVREGSFVFFFGLVGVAAPEALAASLLIYVCRLAIGAIGGVLFLRSPEARLSQTQTSGG